MPVNRLSATGPSGWCVTPTQVLIPYEMACLRPLARRLDVKCCCDQIRPRQRRARYLRCITWASRSVQGWRRTTAMPRSNSIDPHSDTATVNSLIRLRSRLLLRDPQVDLLFQHIERQRARINHLVVELADIELVTELLHGTRTQFQYLQLAHLVGERLGRPGDIPVGFRLHVRLVNRRMVMEVLHNCSRVQCL